MFDILEYKSKEAFEKDTKLKGVMSGMDIFDSFKETYATNYGGHQFGTWAGQLGDGRAITVAEFINSKGNRYEMQLKGAGLTPYSRHADGKAVLRSSVREYIASEYMYNINIPTTRALSLVETGEPVIRDQFYNGNAKYEKG